MSQQGARKVGKAAGSSDGNRCRSRSTAPKAAGGDATVQPARQKYRSKSRNKIPKSVRYDLENALVGLCNVWFEDIKPHLLRNNIKVHVHPPSAGTGAPGAEGDRTPGTTPAPPRCRHVNPGAAPDCPPHPSVNFADFCLMRPTASSVPSPRRRVSRRPGLPSLPSPPPSPLTQSPCNNCESDMCNVRVRKGRKTKYIKSSTHDKFNLNSAVCNELDFHLNLSKLKRVRKKTKTKEMGSQTEYPAPYSICARRHRSCTQLERPQKLKTCADSHRKQIIRRNKSTQTDLYLYMPLKTRSSELALKRRARSQKPASPCRVQSSSLVPSTRLQPSRPMVRSSSRVQSSSHIVRSSSRARSPFSFHKTSPSRLNHSKTRVYGDIFREEFIEDIAEKRDQNILLLYRSPRIEEASSVVNKETVLSVKVQRKKATKT